MAVVAYLWSSVVWLAIPEEEVGGINWRWLIVFVPLACALGMNRVSNYSFYEHGFLFL
jgi:DnaJ family protein C protein 22